MIGDTIKQKLNAAFAPLFLEVEDESYQHSSGPNAQTHFKVALVSEQFAGVPAVARHRAVYATLADELKQGVHALAVHTYTPTEWQGQSPQSPSCKGGSKHA